MTWAYHHGGATLLEHRKMVSALAHTEYLTRPPGFVAAGVHFEVLSKELNCFFLLAELKCYSQLQFCPCSVAIVLEDYLQAH